MFSSFAWAYLYCTTNPFSLFSKGMFSYMDPIFFGWHWLSWKYKEFARNYLDHYRFLNWILEKFCIFVLHMWHFLRFLIKKNNNNFGKGEATIRLVVKCKYSIRVFNTTQPCKNMNLVIFCWSPKSSQQIQILRHHDHKKRRLAASLKRNKITVYKYL